MTDLNIEGEITQVIEDLLIGHYVWAESELSGTKHHDKEIELINKRGDKAKKTLTELVAKARNQTLEDFRVFCYEDHAFEAWDTPQSNRQGWIDTKLRDFAALSSNKQGGSNG